MTIRDLRELSRLRLRNQRLAGGGFASAVEAVAWLGAVQSQDYPMAKWSLGKRVPSLADADVDSVLASGAILRTHVLRPTWHFVMPADIRWMMALTAPRIYRRNQPAGLTLPAGTAIERGLDVMAGALAGGNRLSRAALARLIVERGIVATERDTIPMFMAGELELVIVSGGLAGKSHTYRLVDEVVPPLATFDRDWALAELTRRFFNSHGPATIRDFTWWSSLTAGDTRRGLEINAAEGRGLKRFELGGTAYWWAGDTSDAATADDPSPTIHLMQAFDEYIVAYRSPRTVINVDGLGPPSALNRPPMLHAVVMDGQLIGWWRRLWRGAEAVIDTALLIELSGVQREALEAAAARYGVFVGAPVSVSVGVSP